MVQKGQTDYEGYGTAQCQRKYAEWQRHCSDWRRETKMREDAIALNNTLTLDRFTSVKMSTQITGLLENVPKEKAVNCVKFIAWEGTIQATTFKLMSIDIFEAKLRPYPTSKNLKW